jgi:hypothetical protein
MIYQSPKRTTWAPLIVIGVVGCRCWFVQRDETAETLRPDRDVLVVEVQHYCEVSEF